MNPILRLFRSRKFLLLILDTVISFALYLVGYFNPDALEMTQLFIGLLQPVFVALIAAIALEDAAEKLFGGVWVEDDK
jgi:drug/metabolite transporter (DMT)-like permease